MLKLASEAVVVESSEGDATVGEAEFVAEDESRLAGSLAEGVLVARRVGEELGRDENRAVIFCKSGAIYVMVRIAPQTHRHKIPTSPIRAKMIELFLAAEDCRAVVEGVGSGWVVTVSSAVPQFWQYFEVGGFSEPQL